MRSGRPDAAVVSWCPMRAVKSADCAAGPDTLTPMAVPGSAVSDRRTAMVVTPLANEAAAAAHIVVNRTVPATTANARGWAEICRTAAGGLRMCGITSPALVRLVSAPVPRMPVGGALTGALSWFVTELSAYGDRPGRVLTARCAALF